MILLYANPIEVKYVDYEPKVCIGYKAKYLSRVSLFQDEDEIILFGMGGGSRRMQLDKLYHWWEVIDMESPIVQEYCWDKQLYFKSIRYIIDYDRDKVMPTGINWAWRKFQHKRMQRKFNEYLKTY